MEVTAKFAMANHRIYHGANLRITLGRLKMMLHRIIFAIFLTRDPRKSIPYTALGVLYPQIQKIIHCFLSEACKVPCTVAHRRISAFEKELAQTRNSTKTTNYRTL
jgi:hypothetical protein